jgi:hypothetical protein
MNFPKTCTFGITPESRHERSRINLLIGAAIDGELDIARYNPRQICCCKPIEEAPEHTGLDSLYV